MIEKTYLPDDFYQLYYVCYTNGTYEKPIARKAKTSTGQGPYYDIVGNELIIYRDSVSNMNKIKVQYYPTKWAITYSAKDANLNREGNLNFSNIIDVADRFALVNGTDIWNIIDGSLYSSTTGASYNMLYISAGNPVAITKDANKVYFKVNNNGYYGVFSNGTLNIYTILGDHLIKTLSLPNSFWSAVSKSVTGTFVNDTLYLFASQYNGQTGVFQVNNGTPKLLSACTSTPIVSFNGNVYYNDNTDGIIRNDKVLYPIDSFNEFNGVMKEDLNTGYGILVDKYLLKSNFEDTELSFPNNFFYNYLAYKLAAYYKIKQASDPTGILMMLSEAEKTFYDTLSRDENNFVRISNAYAY